MRWPPVGVVGVGDLPPIVRERCGPTRRTQLAAFIGAMIATTEATGKIGMTPDHADALAAFRAAGHERIYLRPESLEQAKRVSDMLQGLVSTSPPMATGCPHGCAATTPTRTAATRPCSGWPA
ncbi:MAG: hypothetical protein R2695_04430 [Acidimicrobiales bacterium]